MINTKEDFKKLALDIESQTWYKKPLAFGIARLSRGILDRNLILEASFPVVNWNENSASGAIFLEAIRQSGIEVNCNKSEAIFPLTDSFLTFCIEAYKPFYDEKEKHKNLQLISTLASLPIESGLNADDFKVVFIFEDEKPQSVEASYLKLIAKHSKKAEDINLEGIEDLLTNCAWIDGVPVELEWLRQNEIVLKVADKFPKIDYVGKYSKFLKHIIPENNETACKASLLK